MNARSADPMTAPSNGRVLDRLPSLVVTAFLLLGALVVVNQAKQLVGEDWLLASAVVMGLLAAIASLVPTLPWANSFLAAGLALFLSGLLEAVSAVAGFPFGKREFASGVGPMILGLIPWWLPLLWGVVALAARGTARLILLRDGQHPFHGYRVIGLATVLAYVTSVCLEFFAVRAARYWGADAMSAWNFAALVVAHLLLQISLTPLLIDKFPGRRSPNMLPLLVWAALTLGLLLGIIFSGSGR